MHLGNSPSALFAFGKDVPVKNSSWGISQIHILHLEEFSGQKFDLENLPSAFCAFGKVSAVQKSHLVKFRVCRTFDLGKFFQVRKNRTWGGAWPGPVLRRRTGYESGADIRPSRRRTGYGSRADIRPRPAPYLGTTI